MPISYPDLLELSKVSLDEYLRNIPVDQIGVEHPFLKKCLSKRKLFFGAREKIIENVRKDYGSNFTWAYGESPVTFNKRHTTDQAEFPWRRAVDGLYLDFDRLFGAGIDVREGKAGQYKLAQNEKVQLLNLLDEQMQSLKLGFLERLDVELHRDGASSEDAVTGLDALVSVIPDDGQLGGISRERTAWWRNYAQTDIASGKRGALSEAMEKAWRNCIRNGGSPDFILAGSAFLDAYRNELTIVQNANASRPKTLDAGVGTGVNTGLYFKGVEIIWDPTFEMLDALETPTIPWEKRCYLLNFNHIKYRDDEMNIVTPVRPHNVLALYAMVNLRCVLTMNRASAHAVLAIK